LPNPALFGSVAGPELGQGRALTRCVRESVLHGRGPAEIHHTEDDEGEHGEDERELDDDGASLGTARGRAVWLRVVGVPAHRGASDGRTGPANGPIDTNALKLSWVGRGSRPAAATC
jgi:hypothetical protein